jgi:hypothetical protein
MVSCCLLVCLHVQPSIRGRDSAWLPLLLPHFFCCINASFPTVLGKRTLVIEYWMQCPFLTVIGKPCCMILDLDDTET